MLDKKSSQAAKEQMTMEDDEESDSDQEARDRVFTAEQLKAYEEITLYFGKGKKLLQAKRCTVRLYTLGLKVFFYTLGGVHVHLWA